MEIVSANYGVATIMRICFILGGKNIFFERLCEYLLERKHEIHVINLSNNEITVNGSIYHNDFKLKAKNNFSNLIKYFKIRRYIKENIKPDIISAFYITHNGWLAAFTNIHPFVLHVMGSDFLLAPRRNILKSFFNNYAIRRADVIISESETIQNGISSIRKSGKGNFVIQFGVNLNLFKSGLDVSQLKEELNIDGQIVIISPRNSTAIYNQEKVIASFAGVCKERNDIILLLKAQNDKYKKEFSDIAKGYGVLDKIRFYGFVPLEELPLYYNLSKIMISIPSSDSVSVCLQEAMACGVVPVISDLPAPKEWIKEGYNGFVVPINDCSKITQKILSILNNLDTGIEINKINRKIIEQKSDFIKNMNDIEYLYAHYNK
jgi:glycosyltransferase involved in cell wall biosynthesis